MKTVTLGVNDWFQPDMCEYLRTLNGVKIVKIDNEKERVEVSFDEKLTSSKIIKYEVYIYLKILNSPELVYFDKHSNKNLTKYDLVIKDLCCEHCLKGMMEDLFEINGIEKADCNFDVNYKKRENVIINIEYDDTIINEEEIKKIERKMNYEE
jgi:copper chaperone CopZ